MTKCKTPCPNKCKENNETQMILRKDLEKHVTEQCVNRDYNCQHCGKKDTFSNITGIHDDTCKKKVLPCPADCPDSMQRAKIKQHLENDCEHTVISCKYEGIGCYVKMKRKDMGAHEQDDKAHLHQALTTVVKLQEYTTKLSIGFFCLFVVVVWSSFLLYNENTSMKEENKVVQDRLRSATETITSMKEENKAVQDRLQSVTDTITSMKEENKVVQDRLQSATETITSMKEENKAVQDRLQSVATITSMPKKLVVFKIINYEEKRINNEEFSSQSFYTDIDEYNMCIDVYPNGYSDGQGTHVSVFVYILEGDNDDNLDWPFIATVEIELLNQLEDDNHHLMTLTFNKEDNKRVGSSWGYYRFIPHSKLFHDRYYNTQYLKDDTLYFRVSVEVSGHKPWLECTIK